MASVPGLGPDGRAGHLRRACEASLCALDLSVIDLYQLYAPDPRTPFETSVRALAALQRQGMIRHIGRSNVSVERLATPVSLNLPYPRLTPYDEPTAR